MKKLWLIRRYRGLPLGARRILTNEHLRKDLGVLELARQRYPNVYAIPSSMANLLMKAGRSSEALRIWRQMAQQFPGTPNPFFQRANWAMQERNYREAEKYLRLCLARDHGYFKETAHFWRAEALIQLARYDAALAELRSVPDGFEELWFFDYPSRSKSDMLREIDAGKGEQ